MRKKDPLYKADTPYDVLDLDPSAGPSNADVHRAFTSAVGKRRYPPQELQAARTALVRREDRALVDVLYYSVEDNGRSLKLSHRADTARALKETLVDKFPDVSLIHRLALLWYWWAEHVSERYEEGGTADELGKFWERALAYWAALLASRGRDAWQPITGLEDKAQVKSTRESMRDSLRNRLGELQKIASDAGDERSIDRFRQLRLAFRFELDTARHMASASAPPLGDGTAGLGCGRLLLEELGLLRSVRSRVGHLYSSARDDRHLQRVRDALSSYWKVAQRVSNRRWEEALDAIEDLSRSLRRRKEVQALKAEALIGLGRVRADSGDLAEAVERFVEALDCVDTGPIRAKAEKGLVKTCQQIGNCPDSQLWTLAPAMEQALAALPDHQRLQSIASSFGDRLCDEPIQTFNRVQEEVKSALDEGDISSLKPRWRGEWKPDLNRALERLRLAQHLGSSRAKGQLPEAQSIYDQLKRLFERGGGPRSKWLEHLQKAGEAAGRGDWHGAVHHLRLALEFAPGNEKADLRRALAVSLYNEAIDLLNGLEPSIPRHRGLRIVEEAVELLEEANDLKPGDSDIKKALEQARHGKMILSLRGTGEGLGRFLVAAALVALAAACMWLAYRHTSSLTVFLGGFLAAVGITWGTAQGGGLAKVASLDWLAVFLAAVRLGMNDGVAFAGLLILCFFAYTMGLGIKEQR